MAHDEGGLGITAGLLVEAFDGRHFAPLLGSLEAIDQHDRPALHADQMTSEQALEGLPPQAGQEVQAQGRGVEEVEQAVVAGVGEAQSADQAGDARQIGPQAQGGQDQE
jgi:hypothetical protein